MVSVQQSSQRNRRSDAITNELKVRDAAQAVFARLGSVMTMDDVAREAGVSKGTVYAAFGSRKHLIDAMAVQFLDRATRKYIEALEAPSAWDAMVEIVLNPTMGVASTAGDAMNPDRGDDEVTRAYRRTSDALSALIEKGKREGSISSNVTVNHVETLIRGLFLALRPYSPHFVELAREYGMIIMKGIRA
ncbi:TetR/AcrR family transcriptional regulator [Paenarthrobacter ureafaciens]